MNVLLAFAELEKIIENHSGNLVIVSHGAVMRTMIRRMKNIDPKLNFTFNVAQKRDVKVLMSNTFGFGGHNACVLVKKLDI